GRGVGTRTGVTAIARCQAPLLVKRRDVVEEPQPRGGDHEHDQRHRWPAEAGERECDQEGGRQQRGPTHGRGALLAKVATRPGLAHHFPPAPALGELHEGAREQKAYQRGHEDYHVRSDSAATTRSSPRERDPLTSTVAPRGIWSM